MDEMLINDTDNKEKAEATTRRKALVSSWTAKIKQAKGFHDKSYKKMRRDMNACLKGFDDEAWTEEQYVALEPSRTVAHAWSIKYGTVIRKHWRRHFLRRNRQHKWAYRFRQRQR